MKSICEDIQNAIYKARLEGKISKDKEKELENKIGEIQKLEAKQADIRAKSKPEYKEPSVKLTRFEGTRGPAPYTERKTKKKEVVEEIKEEIATSIAGTFGVTPNDVIGRPAPFKKEGKRRQKKAMMNYRYQKIRNVNEDNKMSKIEESYDVIIEAITSILEGVELPEPFVRKMEDDARHERVTNYMNNLKAKEEAKKKATSDEAKRLLHFRKHVLRDEKGPGPELK